MLQEAVGKRCALAPGEGVWRTSCWVIPKLSVGLVSAALGFTLVFGGAGARSALAQEATPGSGATAEAVASGPEESSSIEDTAVPTAPSNKTEKTEKSEFGSPRTKGQQASAKPVSEATNSSKGSDVESVGSTTAVQDTTSSDQSGPAPSTSDIPVSSSSAAAGLSHVAAAPAADTLSADVSTTNAPATDALTADNTSVADVSSKKDVTSVATLPASFGAEAKRRDGRVLRIV